MKRLYLIRHAKSSKDIPVIIKDSDRPLNEEGKKQVLLMGRRLKESGIVPQAVYSSPARRALDTARAIAGAVGFPLDKIKTMSAIYDSNIPNLMRIVRNIDDAAASAAIFGHNPEFLNFVNYLTPRPVGDFPTCGVFGIDFDTDSWRRAGRKKGVIAFFESPKKDMEQPRQP